jgi:DNA-binding IclR family transcriptional regulator
VANSLEKGATLSKVQVLDRAVGILRTLADVDHPLRLTEVARAAKLPSSTAHRILTALVENTLCEQDPDGDYRLGLALYGFGKRVEAGLDLRVRSLPLLKELSETTNLTSFLWVRQGDQAICLERIDGRDSFSMAAEAGSGLPLHTGAAPRMLLALDKEEVIDDYLARRSPLQSFTAKTVTDPEALRRELAETRARGWSISDEDVTNAAAALGAPVFGGEHRLLGAIAVGGLYPHVLGAEQQRIVEALLTTAAAISERLGAFCDTTKGTAA